MVKSDLKIIRNVLQQKKAQPSGLPPTPVDEDIVHEHPDFSDLTVVSYLAHPATANVLRHYLENYRVKHIESTSILDLFSRLNHLQNIENTWLIVDHSGDSQALLTEIRSRYQGHLAVYGYQMQLDPSMLNDHRARACISH